jgi:hypothetical protein
MIRLQQVLRVQARDSAAIRRRLEWRESVTWASKRNGRWTGCGIVEHFCVDSDRTGSTATVQLKPDRGTIWMGHGRPACRLLPRDSDSPVHEAVTLTPALDSLRSPRREHARPPSLQGPPAFKPPFRPPRPCRNSLSTAGGLNQTLPNIMGPASVLNFHLPNLIMRYVVGGGGSNHPWPFPLTHFKLCPVGKLLSKRCRNRR